MNFVTHIQMGSTLYEELYRVVDLDKESFVYGNVKPDCTPKTILKPHTLSNYLDEVLDLADVLMEEDLTREAFSEGLGVMCHFLSDFCCLYHAREEMFHRYLGHGIYELRLHDCHKKKNSSFLRDIFSFKVNPVQNLRQSIVSLREEYLSGSHSLELDLFCAYRLCKLACQSVAYYRFGRILCEQEIYYPQAVYVKEGISR